MKAQIFNVEGGNAGEVELPAVFDATFRPDLIKNAVLAIQSERYQPHGTHPYAGIRTSAASWGSGRGVSQIPRIKNGSRVARVPQARGGRAAHPPKVEKILVRKMNKKEMRVALCSAIAATTNADLVAARGHRFGDAFPVIFDETFESLTTTKEVIAALKNAGVYGDVERSVASRNIRAGKGKLRGRKYKQAKSLLIVTAETPLAAARNLAGVDAISVRQLTTELLAPGTHAGRLTVWTTAALKELEGL
jgi:large subunit ribosomal protein L4e